MAESITVLEGDEQQLPDLRILHFNDVYHVEPGSRDPVGGAARFQTLCNYYRKDQAFAGQPDLLTFFSGDAFNPSLESTVTKGQHMVSILNNIGTNVACVGNHDLDLGVPQYQYLASQCNFPWLLANVMDPSLGDNILLGNSPSTHMLTSSNGIKIGLIGIAEQEWLDTVNALPKNLPYVSASETVKKYAPLLRAQGAEMVIALCHQREVNDNRLAEELPSGMIDIILGGHDHHYRYSKINGVHVLCSGTDFKQLSYIEARRKAANKAGWDFSIKRRDVTKDVPEDPDTVALMEKLFSSLNKKLGKPIGYTAAPLDSRFTTVRTRESNLGNFCADLVRNYLQGDCSIVAGGTIRGDQIYPPGVLKLKDIMDCFPFEDPTVMIKTTGRSIWDALENGVYHYPALEGRFPQVSNITFTFDASKPQGHRIKSVHIGGEDVDMKRDYNLVTRAYMVQGGDGFQSLRLRGHGGTAESLVSEECGLLMSMILRQYFMSLKVLGRWKNWSTSMGHHWGNVQEELHQSHPVREAVALDASSHADLKKRQGVRHKQEQSSDDGDQTHLSDSEDDSTDVPAVPLDPSDQERKLVLMRKVMRKWWRLAGLKGHPAMCDEEGEEFGAHWTRSICPRVEGRITIIGA